MFAFQYDAYFSRSDGVLNDRTVTDACLPSPLASPRYFTVDSSEHSGQVLILPPTLNFAVEFVSNMMLHSAHSLSMNMMISCSTSFLHSMLTDSTPPGSSFVKSLFVRDRMTLRAGFFVVNPELKLSSA